MSQSILVEISDAVKKSNALGNDKYLKRVTAKLNRPVRMRVHGE